MGDNHTTEIEGWISALRKGDGSARERLLSVASDQLIRLTRKMLKDYPGVHRWEQTDDIYQNAVMRLYQALEKVTPATSRDFYGLATTQIRRELIDMARKYSGPMGLGRNHESGHAKDASRGPAIEASDHTDDPSSLAEWTEFHVQVERLPHKVREVFDLVFYQGLTQAEAATIIGVDERTIKRRWLAARLALLERLGDQIPGL